MVDLPTWLRIPDGFASSGDPVDGNPFQPEDARHQVWRDATRHAEEEWARVNARSFSSLSPDNASDWFATFHTERFSVWAQRGIHVVWSDAAVRHYDKWLVGYANATLAMLTDFFVRNPPPVSADPILLDTRNRLGAQIQHWKAEARRYRGQQEEQQADCELSVSVNPAIGTLSTQSERRAAVDAYIAEVDTKTGKKITRKDIWRSARYQTRSGAGFHSVVG